MKKILLTSCVVVLFGAISLAQNKPAAKQATTTQKATAAPKTEAAKTKTTAEKKPLTLSRSQAAKQSTQAAASLAEWNANKSAN